jgi:hypothetical protein
MNDLPSIWLTKAIVAVEGQLLRECRSREPKEPKGVQQMRVTSITRIEFQIFMRSTLKG